VYVEHCWGWYHKTEFSHLKYSQSICIEFWSHDKRAAGANRPGNGRREWSASKVLRYDFT